ncbi:hypothetical protein F4801DRAFT_572847 [Xylaria longipes]|nr:hypothetical protein F4801DRAFT_572847 [Xylaria longipes]
MSALTNAHLLYTFALLVLSQWILWVEAQGDTLSCCVGEDCDSDADSQGLELNEAQTAPNADMSPGLGVEFETDTFYLEGDPACDYKQTDQLKRAILGGRKGDTWELTVDTTLDMANRLQAEYIMNGLAVKIGQNVAGQAAAAIAADLIEWNPSLNSPGITVEGLDGCTWTIKSTSRSLGKPEDMKWQRQITAPMPLEALNDIIGRARADYVQPPLSLLPLFSSRAKSLVYVSAEFFQSMPMSPALDALGFFSLVLSYVKAADRYVSGQSPKFQVPIMPRNDFQSMFNLIKGGLGSSLDSGSDALYTIIKTLACYTWHTDDDDYELEIDQNYCSGNLAAPVVGMKVDQLSYRLTGGKMNPTPSFTIQEWMNDLQANRGDRMSIGDQTYDGQIGGFGDKMEYVLGTTRLVPLFEFRDLGASTALQFATLVTAAENDIINYHNTYRDPPTTPSSKRRIKRQLAECPVNATSSAPESIPETTSITPTITPTVTSFITSTTPAITPAPTVSCWLQNEDPDQGINSRYCVCGNSITAPILDPTLAESDLCAYTTPPTTTMQVSVPTQTWMSNCQACTLVGGIADDATCTMVDDCTATMPAVPTITAWVNNLDTIDIGDAEDGNNGQDLAMELFTKLRSACNDTACDDAVAVMDNVETVLGDGEQPTKPVMRLDDAVIHNNATMYEKMLSLGIATWVSTLQESQNNLCKEVEYEADEDETGSGCGTGPIPKHRLRRRIHRDSGTVLWERDDVAVQEHCFDLCDNPHVCHYTGRVCSAPTHIVVEMPGLGDADSYRIGLRVELEETGDPFLCEELVMDFTEILEVIYPELLPEEAAGEIGLEALCSGNIPGF